MSDTTKPDDKPENVWWVNAKTGLVTFRKPTDTEAEAARANRLDRFHILGLTLRPRYKIDDEDEENHD